MCTFHVKSPEIVTPKSLASLTSTKPVTGGGGGHTHVDHEKKGVRRLKLYNFSWSTPAGIILAKNKSNNTMEVSPPNRSAPENLPSTTYTYVCHSRMNKWMNSTGIPSTNDRATDKVRSARFPLYPKIKWMKKVWMQYHCSTNWGLEPIHPIDLLIYRVLTFSLVNELITCMEMRKACWHDHRFVLEAL